MFSFLLNIQWDRRRRRCPACGKAEHWRSRRRGLEGMLAWVDIYPYRCVGCYGRFYAAGRSDDTLTRTEPPPSRPQNGRPTEPQQST
jgi:hypothetical protein